MSKEERKRFRLVKRALGPRTFHDIQVAAASATEWAASVVMPDGQDIRFRFTRGQLFNESDIGDARV